MNIRKKPFSIVEPKCITTVPQKGDAECTPVETGRFAKSGFYFMVVPIVLCFYAVSILGIGYVGYRVFHAFEKAPTKESIEKVVHFSQTNVHNLTKKYHDSLALIEQRKDCKNADHLQKISLKLQQLASTKKDCFRMLRNDIKEISHINHGLSKIKHKITSDDKYKHLAPVEQLEDLTQKSEILMKKLKNLQSYIKQNADLF